MKIFFHQLFREKYLFLVPIIAAFLVLSINITKPLSGHHDFVPAFNGVIAQNYLKLGIWNLKFGQVSTQADKVSEVRGFYTHYLPTYPLILALLFYFLGDSEIVVRSLPIFFSLISVLSLFLITRRLWNSKTAVLASTFFIFNPMFIYFGKISGIEPVIISMILLAFYFYIRWLDLGKKSDLIWGLSICLFGGLFGWQMNYLIGVIFIYSLLTKRLNWKMLLFAALLLFAFLLQFIHAFILTGSFLDKDLIDSFKSRVTETNLSFGGKEFSTISYIKQEIGILQAYFTRVLLGLSAIYILASINLKFNKKKAVVISLMALGLGHPIIFSRYVFIHDYLNIYLLPFLSLAGALGLIQIVNWLVKLKINNKLICLFISLIIFAFLTERLAYTKALLDTNMHLPGKNMAEVINKLSIRDRDIAIVSPRFNEFYGFFIDFYADNTFDVVDQSNLPDEKKSKYRYLIFIDEDIRDQEKYQKIVSSYKSERINDWTIVNLEAKKNE